MHRVGVIGVGFVGTAVSTGLERVAEVREYDKYKPSESLYDVVNNSDILFLCLPTPMNEDGSCDTSIIQSAMYGVERDAEKRKLIILKSTVPPTTTQFLSEKYNSFGWIFSPEFLTEANFINDFLEQDRIFLGLTKGVLHKEVEMAESLFEDFAETQKEKAVIKLCHSQEAELLKYVSNCFLSTKVSFFNEIKEICCMEGIDYDRVIELLKLDKRIGKTHLQVPGPDGKHGFGGSCFPKDLNALVAFCREIGVDPIVLDSVWTKNLMVREEYEWEELAQVTGEYE